MKIRFVYLVLAIAFISGQHVQPYKKICVDNDPCNTEFPLVRRKEISPKCEDGNDGEDNSDDGTLDKIESGMKIEINTSTNQYEWEPLTNEKTNVYGVNVTFVFLNQSTKAFYPIKGCCNIPATERKCTPTTCKPQTVHKVLRNNAGDFYYSPESLERCGAATNPADDSSAMKINDTRIWSDNTTDQLIRDDNIADPTNPKNSINNLMELFEDAYFFQIPKDDLDLSDPRTQLESHVSNLMNRNVYEVRYLKWNEKRILNQKKKTTYSYEREANVKKTEYKLVFNWTGNGNLTCMFKHTNNNNPINTSALCMPPREQNRTGVVKEDTTGERADLLLKVLLPVAVCIGLVMAFYLVLRCLHRLVKLYKKDKESVENAAKNLFNFNDTILPEEEAKPIEEKVDAFDETEKERLRYTRLVSQTSSDSYANLLIDSSSRSRRGSVDGSNVSQATEPKPYRCLVKAMHPSQSLQLIPSCVKINEAKTQDGSRIQITKMISRSLGNLYTFTFPNAVQQPVPTGAYQKVQEFC